MSFPRAEPGRPRPCHGPRYPATCPLHRIPSRQPAVQCVLVSTALLAVLGGFPPRAASATSRLVRNLEAGENQTLVAYGTSLTAVGAWVDQLRVVLDRQFPNQVTVVNAAQGGATSDWGLRNLDDKVLAHEPDTVLIEFSVNDAVTSPQTPVTHARENLETMIDRIAESNPDTEIILMVMNRPVGHTATARPNLASFNQMVRDVARARGLRLIDHFPAWEKLLAENPGQFLACVPDSIHPMRSGSLLVSTPLILRELGLPPAAADASRDEPLERYLFRSLMDADKDGKVTRGEFRNHWRRQFDKTDTDADGSLTEAELHSADLLAFFDADDDSRVEIDEYLPRFQPLFEQYADAAEQTITTADF